MTPRDARREGVVVGRIGRVAGVAHGRRQLSRVMLFVVVALLLVACSGTYVISSPECPPDDSLATQRHPLGCGIYVPKDTTEQGP